MAQRKTKNTALQLSKSGGMGLGELRERTQRLRERYGDQAQEDSRAGEHAFEGLPTISGDDMYFSVRGDAVGFSLDDGPGAELPCIILAHSYANFYNSQPYKKGQPQPPDCAAVSEHLDELAPPEEWPAGSAQAEKCQLCPKDAFGSATSGDGKACRNTDQLILIRLDDLEDPGELTAEWLEKAQLHRMFVPPTSMKNFGKYAKSITDTKRGAGLPMFTVVTNVVVEKSEKSKQATVFEAAGFVPENDEFLSILERRRLEAREEATRAPRFVKADKKSPVRGSKRAAAGGNRVAPKPKPTRKAAPKKKATTQKAPKKRTAAKKGARKPARRASTRS